MDGAEKEEIHRGVSFFMKMHNSMIVEWAVVEMTHSQSLKIIIIQDASLCMSLLVILVIIGMCSIRRWVHLLLGSTMFQLITVIDHRSIVRNMIFLIVIRISGQCSDEDRPRSYRSSTHIRLGSARRWIGDLARIIGKNDPKRKAKQDPANNNDLYRSIDLLFPE